MNTNNEHLGVADMIRNMEEQMQAFHAALEKAFGPSADQQVCRKCGCTNDDCRQCIAKTGGPCYWVEEDLCSACATPVQLLNSKKISQR